MGQKVIRRAGEQARGVPKSLVFNLLNILVDLETQASSRIHTYAVSRE